MRGGDPATHGGLLVERSEPTLGTCGLDLPTRRQTRNTSVSWTRRRLIRRRRGHIPRQLNSSVAEPAERNLSKEFPRHAEFVLAMWAVDIHPNPSLAVVAKVQRELLTAEFALHIVPDKPIRDPQLLLAARTDHVVTCVWSFQSHVRPRDFR